MKTSTKLFIAAAVLIIIPTGGTITLGLLCFVTGLILLIIQGINNRSNGTAPRPDAGKQNYTYTYNAGKPHEDPQKKQKQDEKPPWEE